MAAAETRQRARDLDARLEALGSVVVAYSGGVDSAYLGITAARVLGDRSICITADSPSYPDRHRDLAIGTARAFHLRHEMVQLPLGHFECRQPRYVQHVIPRDTAHAPSQSRSRPA